MNNEIGCEHTGCNYPEGECSGDCMPKYATNVGVSVPGWKDRQVFVTKGFLNFLTDEQKGRTNNPENIALVPAIDVEKRIADLERTVAALAEQNEKMRKVLPHCSVGASGYAVEQLFIECLSLPDITTLKERKN